MDKPKADRSLIFWGLACAVGGAAMILAAVGVIPFETRPGEAPLWLLAVAGVVFAFAGLAMALLGAGGGSPATGELPPGAPLWMRLTQAALGLGAAAGLATIGSWVAFGPGERAFSIVGIISGHAIETVGRVVFGIGAAIAWLCVALGVLRAARRLRGSG